MSSDVAALNSTVITVNSVDAVDGASLLMLEGSDAIAAIGDLIAFLPESSPVTVWIGIYAAAGITLQETATVPWATGNYRAGPLSLQ